MKQLTIIGRLFYGIGIIAVGVHQIIINNFRPEILPPFPAWAHQNTILPILTAIVLILAGINIAGSFKIKYVSVKNLCLYLGFIFLALIIFCHLPYILIISPIKPLHLEVWFGAGEACAYCGGSFVIAGSFAEKSLRGSGNDFFELWLEKLIPAGRIFYSILIILYGCSHFVYADSVSTMVPKWCGAPMFWTYFVGIALIGSGTAIIFKIWIKPISFLLAFMIFLFFMFFHVPDAIANPFVSQGNEIVRAIVALLFCGIALVIASTKEQH